MSRYSTPVRAVRGEAETPGAPFAFRGEAGTPGSPRAFRGQAEPPGAPRQPSSKLSTLIWRTPEDVEELKKLTRAEDFELFELFEPMSDGKRALHYAIDCKRSPGFLQVLIDAGAPVNLPDDNGKTPLQHLLKVKPAPHVAALWAGNPWDEQPTYCRHHQKHLVALAITLLRAGASIPDDLATAPGNEACAACVTEYWDTVLAQDLRKANPHLFGVVATFLDGRRL